MAIHEAAQRGFPLAAESYDSGRPDYPEVAVERLARALGLRPGRTVVELAAGTGKLTRRFASRGARLVALEPVAAMRDVFRHRLPETSLVAGRAEALPFADRSADGIAVGQAFHWFRAREALDECARILRPGGTLALIWNMRDETSPFMAALTRRLEPLRGGIPSYRDGLWRGAVESHAAFGPLRGWSARFVQRADRETLIDRVRSISFVASLPESEKAALLDEVLDMARGHTDVGPEGTIPLAYRTELFWCARLAEEPRITPPVRRSSRARSSRGSGRATGAPVRRTAGRARPSARRARLA
jgi:ubiquinone/menaquinone biosynthesis C-methylase UbiE